ncbi:porin [Variovorax arabinosiphilus]|uniref:porin n=1 Tax=Variovorax arabinosiphilus TaxID=3053498 RepID=UPI002578185A|nr:MULTISPECIES: porin [unclassified Variovorax]MDM0122561.1 porin [Variovorax sp. J2L1-78]MDM0130910.1 porin [Variovorax sp. J2L1-63]MDM0235324.1 porin [Variovorax sp. J2R1-6]
MRVRGGARAAALAALALAGAASAQSSVTLFGIVDAGVSYVDAKTNTATGSVKQKQYGLSNSGYNSSRLGFRGTEDLGGGLAAGFWLEAPLGNDNGTVNNANFWNRRSTVSLSGGFGEIRLGRDFTPSYWNDTVFDPFGTNGVGSSIINQAHDRNTTFLVGAARGGLADGSYTRSSNSIGYFLPPNLGGFYGQVMYGFDENIHAENQFNSQQGRYAGGRFGYANGPLDVAIAYGQTKAVDRAAAAAVAPTPTALGVAAVTALTGTVKTFNLGASYDLGVVKLFGELSQVKNENELAAGTINAKVNGWLLGATAPVGSGLIRASVGQARASLDGVGDDPRATKFALGYVHNLSKRTALYATVAHTSNKDGSAVTTATNLNQGNAQASPSGASSVNFIGGGEAKSSNGYEFGIRHSF